MVMKVKHLESRSQVYLNDLGGKLRSPVLQVVPVDGKHAIIAAEPPILCSKPPFQQVKNKNSWLICPSYEFDAKLFTGVPFMKNHMENLFSWRVPIRMVICSVTKASLSKHCELQGAAGLRKDSSGIIVGHIANIIVVDLKKKKRNYDQHVAIFFPQFVEITFPKETNIVACYTIII